MPKIIHSFSSMFMFSTVSSIPIHLNTYLITSKIEIMYNSPLIKEVSLMFLFLDIKLQLIPVFGLSKMSLLK